MNTRFVIIEICRKPDEESVNEQIWYYRKTRNRKRTVIYTSKNGYFESFFDEEGNLHRDNDLPALIVCDYAIYYTEHYYFHGQRHRGIYLPAVIHGDGRKEYWVYGEKRSETLSLKF